MSRRWRGGKGFNPHQFQIDWTSAPAPPASPPSESSSATGSAALNPAPVDTDGPALTLPWDFKQTFPQPTEQALEAGTVSTEDLHPDAIRRIHEEHAREMLAALHDLDAVLDARWRGVDPITQRPPATDAGYQRLTQLYDTEPPRLQRWFESLLGTYADAFGTDAAGAFGKAVRAWHAGVDVVAESHANTKGPTIEADAEPVPQLPEGPPIIKAEVGHSPAAVTPTSRRRPESLPAPTQMRIVARLPVPRPLPAAVAAGHFGTDEQGQPIHPSADEVRAITNDHAESLIESIQCLPGRGRAPSPELLSAIQSGLDKYAEDFGNDAAQQLEAYCRRQARIRDSASHSRG